MCSMFYVIMLEHVFHYEVHITTCPSKKLIHNLNECDNVSDLVQHHAPPKLHAVVQVLLEFGLP
jgi:hypothetical protein